MKIVFIKNTAEFPTFKDGHREELFCDALLESSQKGGWVRIKE